MEGLNYLKGIAQTYFFEEQWQYKLNINIYPKCKFCENSALNTLHSFLKKWLPGKTIETKIFIPVKFSECHGDSCQLLQHKWRTGQPLQRMEQKQPTSYIKSIRVICKKKEKNEFLSLLDRTKFTRLIIQQENFHWTAEKMFLTGVDEGSLRTHYTLIWILTFFSINVTRFVLMHCMVWSRPLLGAHPVL